MHKKVVSTILDSVYYESNEQVDTISDFNKQVDPSRNPKEKIHIIHRIRKLSVRQLFDPDVIGIIGQDLITDVQENSRVELSLKSLSQLNTITSKAIVIGSACKCAQVDRNIRKSCTTPDRNIWNHNRVGTPGVNKGVFSPSHGSNSSLPKWTRNIEPLDTSIHVSATQERNSNLSCIEKVGLKSLPNKIVADLESSTRVNLTNTILRENPKVQKPRDPDL